MLGVSTYFFKWHLMGAPSAFDRFAVDNLGASPAFGRAQDEHGPARTRGVVVLAGVLLDAADIRIDGVEGLGHAAVHLGRVVAFEVVRRVAVALEERRSALRARCGRGRWGSRS